ncbi:MAG: DUF294 nucleotidyltransferase-like domain-containing protein [Desulfocapsaceae bacterium]|nr:DUF294 nucleotidyltransferase-like domain-containing protein [Desulfocapsaceae bacterium]
MNTELIEIETFLSKYSPFDMLPPEALEQAAHNLEISYFRAGTTILNYGDEVHYLYIVRSGIVELYRRNGDLHNRLDRGEIFGQFGLLMKKKGRFSARALVDSLLYCLPEQIFGSLCDTFEEFSEFVEIEDSTRLRNAVSSNMQGNDLTTAKVKKLLTREAILLPVDAQIQDAAKIMADENLSSVLIVSPDGENTEDLGQVVGILTDRDLCTRVLAHGLTPAITVAEVMSTDLLALDQNDYVFEAMLTMLRNNVQHLPVLRNGQPLGIVNITDILRYESQNSLLLVSSIFSQSTVNDLISTAKGIEDCFVRMVNEDANSHMIGRAMSVVGKSIIQRLSELAEEQLGSPPVPYCFMTLGSMARDEQLIVTDQDNALILDESYDQNLHGEYFDRFAAFVCQGLADCGYTLCSGEIMATNKKWQKTLDEWRDCFAEWIDDPNPEALLHSCIFFDLDGVCGRTKWAEQLKSFIVRRARKNNRFLACLARNALNRTPPLGFFKNFVMEKDGRHNNSINLKRRGTAPLADIIRVHALAAGSRAQNSFDRLDDIIDAEILPKGRGPDLRDAMEFLAMVRIRHQALDIENHQEPDNNIEPENLSDFERRNLKDAFQILSRAQNFIKYRYTAKHFK